MVHALENVARTPILLLHVHGLRSPLGVPLAEGDSMAAPTSCLPSAAPPLSEGEPVNQVAPTPLRAQGSMANALEPVDVDPLAPFNSANGTVATLWMLNESTIPPCSGAWISCVVNWIAGVKKRCHLGHMW